MIALRLALLMFSAVTQGAIPQTRYLAFRTDYPSSYDVSGYDWLSRLEVFRVFDGSSKVHKVEKKGRRYDVRWDAKAATIKIQQEGRTAAEFYLIPLITRLEAQGKGDSPGVYGQGDLTLESASGRAKLYVEDVSAEWVDGKPVIHHLKADLLYREARSPSRN